ncbi:MAG: glycosyltransferase [Methanotrichaceae archaeon]
MKVLHAPMNIAGQATILSASLRNLGIKSDILTFYKHPFGYADDICLELNEKKSLFSKLRARFHYFFTCAREYDVFHFHHGLSLLPYWIDLPLLRLMGKKVIMHYWGAEIRRTDIEDKYTYPGTSAIEKIYYPPKNIYIIRLKTWLIDKIVNISLVGDYSLLPYSPRSKVLKQAMDLDNIEFVGSVNGEEPIKIVHAPRERNIKGTEYVLNAVDRLKEDGYNIDFILLEKMDHDGVLDICKTVDIVVDQLLLESYGIFAIECMALGKPVLCRIDEEFLKYYADTPLPIVNSDPDTVYDNLKRLIENPEEREEIGIKGRRFAEEVHDAKKIAKQLLEIYESI